MRLKIGETVQPLFLKTIRGEKLHIPSLDHNCLHLQFRRFAGCPICNLHLRSFAQRHAEIVANGVHEVVVFHSSTTELLSLHGGLPFDVIGDPSKGLYRTFGVGCSLASILHPSAFWAAMRGIFVTPRALKTEGGSLGLPADFLLSPAGRIIAVKYGAHAYDQWGVDELIKLAH
jgi:peroxiredoxin